MGLSLTLLGEFALRDENGASLSLPTRKTRALLGYLAANVDRPQPRERLMALLWSAFGEKQARHNLNQALLSLRKLGVPLDSDGERVTLRGDTIDIDLTRYRAGLNRNPAVAAILYNGPFLDGLTVPDPGFEDWLSTTRNELHSQTCSALERAVDAATDDGDTPAAIEFAQRLVALDPLREHAHRRLMRLLHDSSDRAGALRQYQVCADLLKKELHVEPDAMTRDLFEEIRSDAPSAARPVMETKSSLRSISEGAPPDKGAIAVLPFANLSDDSEQEYFADGITEDIITALSNVRSFTVLARYSTFVYKGKAVDAKEIGRALNVHYLVEGSVRRAGDRVRVTAQLIDAATGDHLWADRYDGTLDDIFDVQDRITSTIVGTIEPELVLAEAGRVGSKRPDNMNAYDHLLRGLGHMYKLTPEDTREALKCFEKAIDLDPNYGLAYAYASWCYRRDVEERGMTLSEADQRRALDLAYSALNVVHNDPFVLSYSASTILWIERNYEEALALANRAISLNPTSHRFWNAKAEVHVRRGETEAAIVAAERAIGLSPNNPAIWVSYVCIAEAHLQELRFEEAISYAKQSIRHNRYNALPYQVWAAAAAQIGHEEEARQALKGTLSITPGLTIGRFAEFWPVARFKNLDAYLDGLRMAGLPE